MKLYRFKLYPQSSYITPWQSDTIMGSLCWVMRQLFGESKLKAYLDLCLAGSYPYVLSDCFPGDLLPRPLAGNYFRPQPGANKAEAMAAYSRSNKAKSTKYIDLEEFNTIIGGGQVEIKTRLAHEIQVSILHNSISRLSNTTSDGGTLFEEPETFLCEDYISLYAAIEGDWIERVEQMFAALAKRGLGKRSSVGKGAFDVGKAELFSSFTHVAEANAKVMLSNYIPAEGDPREGQYRAFIKYGKLGGEFATVNNPFKKPVLVFTPGSVFWDEGDRFIYGRTFKGISEAKPEVVQFGCALAIPASLEEHNH